MESIILQVAPWWQLNEELLVKHRRYENVS